MSDLSGRDGNRTSFSDVKDAGVPIATGYCYVASDRHMKTVLDDGTVIEYVRDATGRIVQRSSIAPGVVDAEVIRYTFSPGRCGCEVVVPEPAR